ncbi:S9 family peptidase [Phenylobacterium sp.]|uniref:S9 family peptidase n=1 Tax=Phenylobacterium sp. TaxID=1871053 RepID=UPI0012117633|nr:S9 family peptidase [Phenylobacterium sp.]THD54041.1 MAG: S9 family peptidase [Phenylobacterium sp.]
MTYFKIGAMACALAMLAMPARAEGPSRAPTITETLDMVSYGSPKISPDGKHVIYEQTTTNWDTNAFETSLWLADAKTRVARRLTTSVKSSSDAAWSPDGRWIAFLSDRPGVLPKSPADKKQLYVMPADGGEAQQIAVFEKGVNAFEWAPDSSGLAVAAEAPEPKALKDRKESFGEYHVIHADYGMVHLWRVVLPDADPKGVFKVAAPVAITSGDVFSVDGFAFSPDGKTIAFSAQRDPDLISAFSSAIYTVSAYGGTPKKIVDAPGPNTDPHWSPDGQRIAFRASPGAKYFFYANQKIAVVDRDGGSVTVINPAFDEDAAILRWAPEGIYFAGRKGTESHLYLADPKALTASLVALPGSEISSRFSFADGFKRVAYLGANANAFPEIFLQDFGTGVPVQVTRGQDQFTQFAIARRELVQWKSRDGAQVEGVLYTPADFDPHKKYPLLVVIHGGPTGIDTPALGADRYYPIERFVAKGALVLRPNYRGSAGYGAKFRALNVRNLGVGDYADVISGVDSLIAKGFVDKDRVGAMGWSEGGYISAFITTSSDRFKAVSVGAGISDWMTYYANTDITPFTRQYLLSTPWDDPKIYAKTSPITYIAKAKTPTLIQQGSADKRVPVADSFELRQALEDHGVPVKMVLYDGFGHPINKPKQQRAVMEENENWFGHYIFGEPLAPALTPTPPAKAEKAPD